MWPVGLKRRPLGVLVAWLALLSLHGPCAAFDLQGHRGARGLAPENTLVGFARTLAIGVHTLELDVVVTADGHLVVHHDRRLNTDIARGPDGRPLSQAGPPIRSLSLAELQQFDVGQLRPGSRYASQYPEQQAVPGARIPTLQQVLDLVVRSGSADLRLAVETKLSPLAPDESPDPEDFARELVQALRQAGLARRSSILSFDWRTLAVVQRLAPEINTVYLSAQQRWLDNIGAGSAAVSPWTAGLRHDTHSSVPRMVKAAGGHSWSAHFGDLDARKVREAQALGLKVLAWTVNLPADIDRMLDWGVDGIVSDRPDLVREAMRSRGLPLPRPVHVSPH